MLKFGRLGRKLCKPETLSRVCTSFFPFKHFLQDRNKIDEEKKNKSNTIDNEMSLTTFSVILNISSKAIMLRLMYLLFPFQRSLHRRPVSQFGVWA